MNLHRTLPVIVPIYSCERLIVEVGIAHRVSRRSTVLRKLDPEQVELARNTKGSV